MLSSGGFQTAAMTSRSLLLLLLLLVAGESESLSLHRSGRRQSLAAAAQSRRRLTSAIASGSSPFNVRVARNGEDEAAASDSSSSSSDAAAGCGQTPIEPNVMTRVVGGAEAVPHSWPWQVSLQYSDGPGRYSHFCGGSLINNRWVLSAAHCARGVEMGGTVVVGLHSQDSPDNMMSRVNISRMIIHEKYDESTISNDMMLIELATPVEFNDAVRPVCLPDVEYVDPPHGTECYATGWGTLSLMGYRPDRLMQVMLPIVERDICNQPEMYDGAIYDTMICVGYYEGGKSVCHGDSGGPVVCREGDRWVQYGVASWVWAGVCAAAHFPAVYVRVPAYLSWIDERIQQSTSG